MGHLGLAYSSVTFSEKCMVQLRCGVYMLIRHHILPSVEGILSEWSAMDHY